MMQVDAVDLGALLLAQAQRVLFITGAGVSAGASQVQLSPQATALLGAESVLNETAVVDTKRVAEIKQAIAEGRFSINPEKIADGLLDNVRQMLKNQPQG